MREPWQPQCSATTSGFQCEKEEGHEGSHAHETDADITWGSTTIRWDHYGTFHKKWEDE